MKTKLTLKNRDQIKFPFSELPSVLQARIASKLSPQDFGNLLQSSKEVGRKIKKYAVSTCDNYFFRRQQNIIKKFIHPYLTKSIFDNVSCENKESYELLKKIYYYNFRHQDTNLLFPTETIQNLIHKINEKNNTFHRYASLSYRERFKPRHIIIPNGHGSTVMSFPSTEPVVIFLLFILISAAFLSMARAVRVLDFELAVSLITLGIGVAFFAYIMPDRYIQARLVATNARYEKEISRLITELDNIFLNLPKEVGSVDFNINEKNFNLRI